MLNRLAACMVLLGAASLSLLGCTAGEQPFAKNVNALATPRDAQEWPRVTVSSFSGLPEGKDALFLQALAAETYRRQIALVNSPPGAGLYALSGAVSARDVDGRTAVSWNWDVTGWKNGEKTTLSGQEFVAAPKGAAPTPPPNPDSGPWGQVDDFMLRRVAMHMAEGLSSYFGERGYLTQTAGLPPPVETFVRAGPGAEKDIDLTMLGPNELDMRRQRGEISEEQLAMAGLPSLAAPPADGMAAEIPSDAAEAEAGTVAQSKPEDSERAGTGTAIRSVAVAAITGAPGDGNLALAASLRKILRNAGWPVKDKTGPDTLVIKGAVGVAPPSEGVQRVSLEWTVNDPEGKVLGSIKQANQVPAGSLDGKWGLTADYAAEAASYGIFELVSKLR